MRRLDAVVNFFGPDAGRFEHFPKMQASALLHQFALLHRGQKTGHKAVQRLAQAQIRLVKRCQVVLGAAHRLGEGRAVQPGLVAEVVADGGQIRTGSQRYLARRGLGKAFFGKQPQRSMQQQQPGFGTIGALLARLGSRRGGIA